ncbi:unnamed protein product [Larinioides sclopetarius]|uniref:Uncharacterized protein n=1 Tax=Larinioides sclopetarius TaxID=280406 RepID=A0AAV1YVM0_9ARAC
MFQILTIKFWFLRFLEVAKLPSLVLVIQLPFKLPLHANYNEVLLTFSCSTFSKKNEFFLAEKLRLPKTFFRNNTD